LPRISIHVDQNPKVTKVIFYLKMNKIPYKYQSQDLTQLDVDAPFGKLPYIIDDDGTKVADSNAIISYLAKKHGDALDDDLTRSDRAVALAFDRMVCEHLYYSGVLEPRWHQDAGFETYIPYVVNHAPVSPELRAMLDAFRVRILASFDGQGMGRRDSKTIVHCYQQDVDALADFLGSKRYLLGDRPRSVDAGVYAMLRHLCDQPQKWEGTGYIEGKDNLVEYMHRMKGDFEL
jgi:isoprene-epoxide---glutathione S-transferase